MENLFYETEKDQSSWLGFPGLTGKISLKPLKTNPMTLKTASLILSSLFLLFSAFPPILRSLPGRLSQDYKREIWLLLLTALSHIVMLWNLFHFLCTCVNLAWNQFD